MSMMKLLRQANNCATQTQTQLKTCSEQMAFLQKTQQDLQRLTKQFQPGSCRKGGEG